MKAIKKELGEDEGTGELNDLEKKVKDAKMHEEAKNVAMNELNTKVKFTKKPIAVNEIHLNQINRSHFISLLYLCKLTKPLNKKLKYISGNPKINQWRWFKKSPKNLIPPHKIYKKFINK